MKKITVTVAIPAYNEEKNIGSFLDSLLVQKEKRIKIDKIVVYTDGSQDQTPEIVRKKMKKSSLLKLIESGAQKGKFFRLNQIYQDNKSDVLIVLDADIAINSKMFIDNFAYVFVKDPKAQIVSAHELPVMPKSFVGHVIASTYTMWDQIRWSVPDYDHVQNLYARATAYRGKFAKKLHIPDAATEERLYLYLMAKKHNGYRYTTDAVIYYLPVNTIYDYVKLSERAFGRPQPAVNKLFGYNATYHYTIDEKYKKSGMIKSFLKDPFYTPLGILLGVVLAKMTLGRKTQDTPLWEVSLSSKEKITI